MEELKWNTPYNRLFFRIGRNIIDQSYKLTPIHMKKRLNCPENTVSMTDIAFNSGFKRSELNGFLLSNQKADAAASAFLFRA